jgi:hypothetical protein
MESLLVFSRLPRLQKVTPYGSVHSVLNTYESIPAHRGHRITTSVEARLQPCDIPRITPANRFKANTIKGFGRLKRAREMRTSEEGVVQI